jgi:hypothetical protein
VNIVNLTLNSEKNIALMAEKALANDLADYLLQTIFTVIIRSSNKQEDMWNRFQQTFSKATRWMQTIKNWGVRLSTSFQFSLRKKK